MKEWFLGLELVASIAEHVVPIAIIFLILFAWMVFKLYYPQLHYIALVTNASDEKGIEELAKYMAYRNGGKYIYTDHLWESFVPAAEMVHFNYLLKVNN